MLLLLLRLLFVLLIFLRIAYAARGREARVHKTKKDAAPRLHTRAIAQFARPWPRLWSV